MYDLATMEAALTGTIFAGKLHFAALTGSTSTDALEAARDGAPHGSVYFADAQSAGRGRSDHRWESGTGQGLYISVLLRIPLPAKRLQLLPLAAGLAARQAIHAASGLCADLRWPNDLLLTDQKVCGILVESRLAGEVLDYAVVGIGINVHQRSFPGDLATPATSLDLATGRVINREALLVALLKSLEREALATLEPDAVLSLPARITAASTWARGKKVDVHGPQACTGITAGIDARGFLQVDTGDGIVTIQTGGIRAAKAG